MKRLSSLLWVLALALTLSCGKAPAPPSATTAEVPVEAASAPVEGIALAVTGKVEIQKPGAAEWLPLNVKDAVPPGSTIRSGDDGEADILVGEKCALRVKPGTLIELTDNKLVNNAARIDVKLDMGRLLHRFDGMPQGSECRITTPSAGAVIRGTQFDMKVEQGTTNVRVLNGKVEVENASGRVEVKEREGTSVASGAAPASPRTLTQKDVDEVLECSVVRFTVALEKTRRIATLAEMHNLNIPLDMWALDHGGVYPPDLKSAGLDRHSDQWGTPYRYECVNNGTGYVIVSNGPDKQANTDDDLEFRR